jgi:hypothetical protein
MEEGVNFYAPIHGEKGSSIYNAMESRQLFILLKNS